MIERDDKDRLFKEALQIYTQEVDFYFNMKCSHEHCTKAEEYYAKRYMDAVLKRSKFIAYINGREGINE